MEDIRGFFDIDGANVIRLAGCLFAAMIVTSCSGGGGSTTPPVVVTPPSNAAPVVAQANADQAATVGTAFDYDAAQSGNTFTDSDGDTLTYSVSFDPAANGLAADNGRITGTPSAPGTVATMITATDPSGAAASDTFEINIANPTAATKPNILLIIADDLGQDSSAQYALSADLPDTPTLDGLAANGLVFENLWVNPTCSPTRSTLLTARYGERTNVLTPGDPLPAGETILHDFLDQAPETSDYVSALVGKWHLGGGATGPNNAGLDHFAGITGGGVGDYFDWTLNVNGTTSQSTTYATTELTDQAIDWIGAQSDPWFLWLAYNAPHTPYHLPPNTLHPRTLSGDAADINANSRDYYLAAIEAMDTEMGRLLGTLSAADLDNTVILFIGDNGTPSTVRDQSVFPNGAKGSLFEGGVRVPMIVSGAGVTRTGQRETALINGTDFFTTISQLAGGSTAAIEDSQSFFGLLSDANAGSRDHIYSETDDGFAVRGPRYKLVEDLTGAQQLYDLTVDPLENTNLLNSGTDVSAILSELEAARDAIR